LCNAMMRLADPKMLSEVDHASEIRAGNELLT